MFRRLDAAARTHLVSLYGAEAEDVVRTGLDLPGGLERIHRDAPDVWAQARYAVEREWAVTAEDIARRTTLAVRGLAVLGSPGEPGQKVGAAGATTDRSEEVRA